jgi:hypothetical protein
VNNVRNPDDHQTNRSSRHPAVTALVVVLALEAAALIAAAVYLLVEILVATPTSLASAVGITVIVAAGAVWVVFIALGVLRSQAWTRAAVVVVQVLIGAVAIGSFQGPTPRPDLGVMLFIPVVAALVLLFQKPVLAATSDRGDTGRTY